ncbi:hypothetical protein OHV05_36695 (plasmid) [Kitasatospora sp. NBC_00070]|uniref:hypothetical protein n=1 Tax=Kitasatospora sp. NBC_00070 TaxID=2975962 RepID=UPI002F91539A
MSTPPKPKSAYTELVDRITDHLARAGWAQPALETVLAHAADTVDGVSAAMLLKLSPALPKVPEISDALGRAVDEETKEGTRLHRKDVLSGAVSQSLTVASEAHMRELVENFTAMDQKIAYSAQLIAAVNSAQEWDFLKDRGSSIVSVLGSCRDRLEKASRQLEVIRSQGHELLLALSESHRLAKPEQVDLLRRSDDQRIKYINGAEKASKVLADTVNRGTDEVPQEALSAAAAGGALDTASVTKVEKLTAVLSKGVDMGFSIGQSTPGWGWVFSLAALIKSGSSLAWDAEEAARKAAEAMTKLEALRVLDNDPTAVAKGLAALAIARFNVLMDAVAVPMAALTVGAWNPIDTVVRAAYQRACVNEVAAMEDHDKPLTSSVRAAIEKLKEITSETLELAATQKGGSVAGTAAATGGKIDTSPSGLADMISPISPVLVDLISHLIEKYVGIPPAQRVTRTDVEAIIASFRVLPPGVVVLPVGEEKKTPPSRPRPSKPGLSLAPKNSDSDSDSSDDDASPRPPRRRAASLTPRSEEKTPAPPIAARQVPAGRRGSAPSRDDRQ